MLCDLTITVTVSGHCIFFFVMSDSDISEVVSDVESDEVNVKNEKKDAKHSVSKKWNRGAKTTPQARFVSSAVRFFFMYEICSKGKSISWGYGSERGRNVVFSVRLCG